ncbi:MAG: DUF3298 and DUF4163 domain-containing protein [Marinoscillum sp.]
MKYIFHTFCLSLMLFSCSSEKKSQEIPADPSLETESLSSKTTVIEEKSADCSAEPCTKVSISYPSFEGNGENALALNKIIKRRITKILSEDYVMDATGNENIEQLIQLFLKSYDDFKESFPESNTPWTLDVEITKKFENNAVVSLEITTNSYTGGAHPNTFISFLNIRKTDSKDGSLSDFISNTSELTKLLEQQFRKEYDLAGNASLSESGFNFDNDQFKLPDTFGFSKQGMVFYYNSYEIAPYSEGPTQIVIPYARLTDIVKF